MGAVCPICGVEGELTIEEDSFLLPLPFDAASVRVRKVVVSCHACMTIMALSPAKFSLTATKELFTKTAEVN